MKRLDLEISSRPEDMQEGLFGQVVLYVFGALPTLYEYGIYPRWNIHALHYAAELDGPVFPGLFDLAYKPPPEGAGERVTLLDVVGLRPVALGQDWPALNRLWTSYFRIPEATDRAVAGLGDLSETVGIHYRGTDKLTATWDTNPVSQEQFIRIVADYLKRRPQARRVFVATDDKGFAERLRGTVALPVIDTGEVAYHKAEVSGADRVERTWRAMVDAVALSRCQSVLITSSALSAFAKVLNPDLEIHRAAASKMFVDVPYFPVCFIPQLTTPDPEVQGLLDGLMAGDWSTQPAGEPFKTPFAYRPRFAEHRYRTETLTNRLTGLIERSGLKPKATVGRNDPCPCGSGRKFKQCHGR